MGLIKAALGATGGVMADQWKDYFYCEALNADILAVKGKKKITKKSSNKHGDENIITNGSIISVATGQCMIIVDQGKVLDLCAEPGEYTYDMSQEPSIFTGDDLSSNIGDVFANIGKRFTFGGEAPKDQRIYYINTKEIIGNKYGTASPVPFRVVDTNIGLDMDISIKCFGEYSYRITNPILFYTNICGNVDSEFTREEIDSQMKTELLTALQPAFAKISDMGIRYSSLPGHTEELATALNQQLSAKWKDLRGIEIISIGINSIKADEEDEKMIKELQRNRVFMNPGMAAAQLVGAQAQAMQDAAKNTGGAAMGFMGMNMAGGTGGINAKELFEMNEVQKIQQVKQQQIQQQMQEQQMKGQGQAINMAQKSVPTPTPNHSGWTCSSCGTVNKGKFCMECGAKKPIDAPLYRCDKCGWEPDDPQNPPKFCPECGDPFNEDDQV